MAIFAELSGLLHFLAEKEHVRSLAEKEHVRSKWMEAQ